MTDLDNLVEVLQEISNTLTVANYGASTVSGPGILEGGFMRMHDRLSSMDDQLSNIGIALDTSNTHLERIAKALVLIAETVERRM